MIQKITMAIPIKEIMMIKEEITKENIPTIKINITTIVKIMNTMPGITRKKPIIKEIITQAAIRIIPTKIKKMIHTKNMTTKIQVIKENIMTTMTLMTKGIKKAIRNLTIMTTKTLNRITKKMKAMGIINLIKEIKNSEIVPVMILM